MGHPSSFLSIVIPNGFDLLGSMDDLRNFYHEFAVSQDRARSTPVGPTWAVQDWQGSQASKDLQSRFPHRTFSPGQQVYSCFRGLSMGDHWAPTIAQTSHEQLLKSFDALRDNEHLVLGHPLPRAPLGHFSGVCIDDRVNLQFVPQMTPKNFGKLRDEEAIENAAQAYKKVGLSDHPKKRLRRAAVYSAWGAQIEGRHGFVGMKRERLVALSIASMRAAKSPAVTRRLVESMLGSWAFAFQFRRCLFSLVHQLYGEGPVEGNESTPFKPSKKAREEMQLLAILGPTSLTQLRAQVAPKLYATDASPVGAGAVSAEVGSVVAQEIYRRGDTRGFHTRLLPPISEELHKMGVPVDESLASNTFADSSNSPDIDLPTEGLPAVPKFTNTETTCATLRVKSAEFERVIRRVVEASRTPPVTPPPNLCFDFIELYAGSTRMSDAFSLKGFVVGPPLDLTLGWDLTNKCLYYWLMFMCLAGRIKVLWVSPPNSSFTVARSPKLRSKTIAIGHDVLNLDTLVGNYHMHASLALWAAQWAVGNVGLLETPQGAFSRRLPFWKWLVALGGVEIHVDSCIFGTPYCKANCVLSTHAQLRALSRICSCAFKHEPLVGKTAKVASAYPVPMCHMFAEGVHELLRCHCPQVTSGVPDSLQQSSDVPLPAMMHYGKPQTSKNGMDSADHFNLGDSRTQRKFVSHLWSAQLSESLPWKVCRKYKFKRPAHINVLESHVRRSLLLHVPSNMRVVILQDSMVVLGAGAKGRSSSQSLNKVLTQEMAICVARDIYVCGIHSPTWAIRADDPSRGKTLTPPRAPLPKWILLLRRGHISQAQDALDSSSGTPRALSRWFLFGAVARLAASAEFPNFSSWAAASRSASGPSRLGKGPCHSADSKAARQPIDEVCGMAQSGRTSAERVGICCASESCPALREVGRVWQSDVRTGILQEEFRRNDQCCPTEISIPEDPSSWPMAAVHHVGECLSKHVASTSSLPLVESHGQCSVVMGLEQTFPSALIRLLRFVETSRDAFFESKGLHSEFGQWLAERGYSSAAHGQNPRKRSQISVSSRRRALRDLFFAEKFKDHDAVRADLASFSSPFPN